MILMMFVDSTIDSNRTDRVSDVGKYIDVHNLLGGSMSSGFLHEDDEASPGSDELALEEG